MLDSHVQTLGRDGWKGKVVQPVASEQFGDGIGWSGYEVFIADENSGRSQPPHALDGQIDRRPPGSHAPRRHLAEVGLGRGPAGRYGSGVPDHVGEMEANAGVCRSGQGDMWALGSIDQETGASLGGGTEVSVGDLGANPAQESVTIGPRMENAGIAGQPPQRSVRVGEGSVSPRLPSRAGCESLAAPAGQIPGGESGVRPVAGELAEVVYTVDGPEQP